MGGFQTRCDNRMRPNACFAYAERLESAEILTVRAWAGPWKCRNLIKIDLKI